MVGVENDYVIRIIHNALATGIEVSDEVDK
jgi:hypothetical protein